MSTVHQSRRAAIALLVFLATLPLQWQELATTPAGVVRWFQIGALAMLALAWPPREARRAIYRTAFPFLPALGVFTVLMVLPGLFGDGQIVNVVQHLLYAVVGLLAGAVLLVALREPAGRRLLAWAAPVSLVVFLVTFSRALQSAGINPVGSFQAAFSGHPEVLLHDMFRGAFSTGEDEAVSQARHEIFAALLVSVYVSCTALARGLSRLVAGAACLACLALVTVSLSRSVLLATVLVAVPVVVRFMVRGRANPVVMLGVATAALSLVFVGPTLYQLLYERIVEDTSSYEGRVAAFSDFAPGEVTQRLLWGGPPLEHSTHMMVPDASLTGSVFAGLAAAVLVLIVARHIWRAWVRYLREGRLTDLAALGCGLLVLVRMFTAGGGLLHLAIWTAFGVMLAVETLVDRPADLVPVGAVGHELDDGVHRSHKVARKL